MLEGLRRGPAARQCWWRPPGARLRGHPVCGQPPKQMSIDDACARIRTCAHTLTRPASCGTGCGGGPLPWEPGSGLRERVHSTERKGCMQGGFRGVSAEGGAGFRFALLCPVWSACLEGRGGLSWAQGCPSQPHSHSAEPAAPLREPRWALDTQAHPGTHRDMCPRVLPPSLRDGRCGPRGGRAKGAAPREPCLPAWTLPPRQWRGAPGAGGSSHTAQASPGAKWQRSSLPCSQMEAEKEGGVLPSPSPAQGCSPQSTEGRVRHAASRSCGAS